MGWQLSADQNFVFRLRPFLESYDEIINKALLRDHFEVEWSQDSNFYTIPELRGLEVRDEEAKLSPTKLVCDVYIAAQRYCFKSRSHEVCFSYSEKNPCQS